MDAALSWLLDPVDPAVRAKALVDLVGRAPDDADVQAAREASVTRGSVAALLEGLGEPRGDASAVYLPKYDAPFHRVVALAEMGASDPRVVRMLDHILDVRARPDGGFGRAGSHLCVTGNLVRAAFLLGRGDDPRVRSGVRWLVDHQLPNGAWTCFPEEEPQGTLDAWEPLAAFAAMPEEERPREGVRRGVEYLLSEGLGVGHGYAPWERIHFPRHYYYDVLVGLELATSLGAAADPRILPARRWLEAKRRPDGRWALDAQHPDIAPGTDYTPYAPGAALPLSPLFVEPVGAPSRWATLAALRVRARV